MSRITRPVLFTSLNTIIGTRSGIESKVPFSRTLWTFEREFVPPLKDKRESPYIVGPYLKPDYIKDTYQVDPIKVDEEDDDEYRLYKPTEILPDEDRKILLLLLDDVEDLGTKGQIVEAPYRLGASKLIAAGKADYATEFNKNWYKFGPRTIKSASSALSPRTVRGLKNTIFNLYLSSQDIDIQPWHLALALRRAGVHCPISAIKKETIERCKEGSRELIKCTVVINKHEEVVVGFQFPRVENEDDLDPRTLRW